MNKNNILFENLDPEVADKILPRRNALFTMGKLGAAAAMLGSLPVSFAALSQEAFGQGTSLPQQVVDALNFALTLEYLETEFYTTALASAALGGLDGFDSDNNRAVFEGIRFNEAAHVQFIINTLGGLQSQGGKAIPKPTFDFTAGGMFSPFTDYSQFLLLSQSFEETGVRAYKGQAPVVKITPDILDAALQIHSVEARHVATIRRIRKTRGKADIKSWITGENGGGAPAAIYEGETNMNGLTASSTLSLDAITESFDEPLAKAQVLAIADPFIVG